MLIKTGKLQKGFHIMADLFESNVFISQLTG